MRRAIWRGAGFELDERSCIEVGEAHAVGKARKRLHRVQTSEGWDVARASKTA